MINQKLTTALNEQVQKEMFSAYLYLSMSAYFEDENLSGFAHWMKEQAKEEQFHAMKLFNYIIERGGRVELLSIDKPQQNWENIKQVFTDSLEHERYISSSINELMDLAIELNDHAAVAFLQWYVVEQVEEEANVENILSQLDRIGDSGSGVLVLDRHFATRVED